MKSIAIAIVTMSIFSATASALPHDDIKPSLVYIKMTSTSDDEKHPLYRQEDGIESQTTGFVISEDGFILTSHHLLDEHLKSNGIRPKITGVFGHYQGEEVELSVVNANAFLDIALLKARLQPGDSTVPVVLEPTPTNLTNSTELFTSGFSRESYRPDDGNFIDDLSNAAHLLQVSMELAGGRSGSPIYLENGRVIGIVKGVIEGDEKSVFVPIGLADGLIGGIHVEALRGQVVDLSNRIDWLEVALGKAMMAEQGHQVEQDGNAHARLSIVEDHLGRVESNFSWSASLNADSGDLTIRYKKLLDGELHFEQIDVFVQAEFNKMVENVQAVGERNLQRSQPTTLIRGGDNEAKLTRQTLSEDRLVGEFVVPSFDEILERKIGSDPDIEDVQGGINRVPVISIRIVDEGGDMGPSLLDVLTFSCNIRLCYQ